MRRLLMCLWLRKPSPPRARLRRAGPLRCLVLSCRRPERCRRRRLHSARERLLVQSYRARAMPERACTRDLASRAILQYWYLALAATPQSSGDALWDELLHPVPAPWRPGTLSSQDLFLPGVSGPGAQEIFWRRNPRH